METKIINNRYELIACTAIATEAGDTEVQDAIYCRSTETSDGDCVYFGYTLDDLDDLDDLADADCPDFSEDTLRTVRIDGQPISAYCF